MLKLSQRHVKFRRSFLRFTPRRTVFSEWLCGRKVELPAASQNTELPKVQVNMNTGTAPIPMPVRSVAHGSFRFPSRFARFGDFELDIQKQELYRGGIRIKLQTKVYEALLVLLEAPQDVISREVIRQRLWPGDSLVNFDANVNTTVNKLRQLLGDSPESPA